MNLPAARDLAQPRRNLGEQMVCAVVLDRVHRVEPQPVEMELLDPERGVLDHEFAHRFRALGVVVHRRAPGRVMQIVEDRRIGGEVVAVGAEVVIDHVEQHHDAAGVRGVDQRFQIVGVAVAGIRREQQHAVIAPVAAARKLRHRHQFDRGDAELGEIVQPLDRGREGALGREGADMQFVDHRLVPRPAAPGLIGPDEARRIDHFARAVHVVGLMARRRVGHPQPVVELEHVARAGPGLGDMQPVPAVRRRAAFAAGYHHSGPARPDPDAAPTSDSRRRRRRSPGRTGSPTRHG